MALATRNTPFFEKIIPAMLNYYDTENYVFIDGWIPCIREKTGNCYIGDWRHASDSAWSAARCSTNFI